MFQSSNFIIFQKSKWNDLIINQISLFTFNQNSNFVYRSTFQFVNKSISTFVDHSINFWQTIVDFYYLSHYRIFNLCRLSHFTKSNENLNYHKFTFRELFISKLHFSICHHSFFFIFNLYFSNHNSSFNIFNHNIIREKFSIARSNSVQTKREY